MRAIEPVSSGFAANPEDGVNIHWESFGPQDAKQTIVFLPTWLIVHSRIWKGQVPYFAQHGFRVVTYDPRGNGKSDRPASGYQVKRHIGDTLAVCAANGVERAAFVGLSWGARPGVYLAAEYPEMVEKLILIGASIRFEDHPMLNKDSFLAVPPDREGWNKYTAVHWREEYRDFREWFFNLVIPEPHMTRMIDDMMQWSDETNAEVLIANHLESSWPDLPALAARVKCPTLILHGENDNSVTLPHAVKLHETIEGSKMVIFEDTGHGPAARNPVQHNEIIHDFLGREFPVRQTFRRGMSRPKRALWVSSPIGLGHVQRDIAIARELRRLVPDLEIEWLAQHPVTKVLEANGEKIHPLSELLSSESGHVEAEMTGEHELYVFESLRTMDEILLANFFVFLQVVRETHYDLWIADEAWDVDFHLHENPELKTAPYVWMTDMTAHLTAHPEDPGEREAYLTADYNAEMIEQIERYPWVRDRAFYIGTPEDLVDDTYGPGLPSIREWTLDHYECVDYVRYVDPDAFPDRQALRERFGFGPDERVAVAAVGGTSTGQHLLRRIVESYPIAREMVPNLRLLVVCGPRIDPASLPDQPGVEYLGYVHNLYELFAAADVALVQGGLSTTMELVTLNVPFLYFPLKRHYEQQRHVTHRLERYGVPDWARLQYDDADGECIAEHLVRAINEPVRYLPVDGGGAHRVAGRIAELLPRPRTAASEVDLVELVHR